MSAQPGPRREGTPGGPSDFFLVVAALVLLMPTAVAVWLVTAWWLRRQYASRWWPLLLALVLAPLLLVVGAPRAALGGILAAVEAFQVPRWTLLPIVYASTVFLARVAWSTSALAFPVGLAAAAAIAGPRAELPGMPSPALRRRAARSEQREVARVERVAAKPATPPLALGVVAGPGDLPAGWVQGEHLVLPPRAATLPRVIVGRPGQGKSVYLTREVALAGIDACQAIVADCKGERGFADQVEAAYQAGWDPSGQSTLSVHRWPDEPLNCWTGGPAAVANRLLSVWQFDVASLWYREIVELTLRLALHAPAEPVTSSRALLQRMQPGALAALWRGHEEEEALVKSLGSKLDDVTIRLANLLTALGGLLDGSKAIGDSDLTVLSLPTMGNEHQAAAILRVVLADLAHYVSSRKPPDVRALAVVDEFSAVPAGREHAIHLAERGRSAGVATVLAVQSARGLGDDEDADRLIGATGAVVLFGTAEPERILKLAGTIQKARMSVTTGEHYSTTTSEATEYRVDGNDVRALPPGYAYVLASGRAQRIKVLRPPGGDQPCAAAPAGAADDRGIPVPTRPRQGSAPAAPLRALDPSGRPPEAPAAPHQRWAEEAPPDDRDNQQGEP